MNLLKLLISITLRLFFMTMLSKIILSGVLPFCHLEHDEFNMVIYELANGPVKFDETRLSSLKFNPLIPGNSNLTLSSDLDPESNFDFDKRHCKYHTEHKINELSDKTSSSGNSIYFPLLHLNIRSLNRSFDNLVNFLASITSKFSVIGISKTWLADFDHTVDIDGYNFIHKHRPSRTGGGVGMYLDVDIEFKFGNDLSIDTDESLSVESLFIEVCRLKRNNLIVGVIYRPPDSDVKDFAKN